MISCRSALVSQLLRSDTWHVEGGQLLHTWTDDVEKDQVVAQVVTSRRSASSPYFY